MCAIVSGCPIHYVNDIIIVIIVIIIMIIIRERGDRGQVQGGE